MSGWAYYFIVKVFLHLRGHIPFDVVANGVFAMWVMIPTPASLSRFRAVVWARRAVTVAAAVLLAWHDSWLPPLPSAVAFVRDTPLPSAEFSTELLWRNVATAEVGVLLAIIAAAVL